MTERDLGGLTQPAEPARALVQSVASRLQGRLPDITGALRERLSARIAELRTDPTIADMLGSSIEGNIDNILYLLRYGVPVDDVEPPSAAYEYARRLAQRGVPVSALVRAYRLGQQQFLEFVFAECNLVEPDAATRFAAEEYIVATSFDYIDWISQGVVVVYEGERERWLAERSSARSARIEDLLAHRNDDIDAAEAVLGYRLRVPHVGIILWTAGADNSTDQISRFTQAAAAFAERLGSNRAPLVLPRDRASAWVWLEVDRDPSLGPADLDPLLADKPGPHEMRAAIGRTASGLDGFRRTHREALQAQQVAMIRNDADRRVTFFAEPGLGVSALLAQDLDATRVWVAETLGELAIDDEQHERLRTTLLTFFQHDSSYTATAEAIVMHKNSVKYRISSAEKALGRSIRADRQAIELALTACHWLGRSMLTTED